MTGLPAALYGDPPPSPHAPATTLAQAIPSGGHNLNALLYTAAGEGPHPTILLLHGLPGNEQNIDLAQSLRRAGWNVLTVHYRGSWGGPGQFSFEHCVEDAAAALDWLSRTGAGHRIDPARILVIGHSMGGFVAAQLCAAQADVLGAVLLSCVDLGRAFGSSDIELSAAKIDQNVGTSAGLHILAGTSPRSLAEEARVNADRWRLAAIGARLADRPLLIVTSDDGFSTAGKGLAAAVQAIGGGSLSVAHFATDHSYSDCRIALQARVLDWLQQHYPFPPAPIRERKGTLNDPERNDLAGPRCSGKSIQVHGMADGSQ
ncbi:alpha/beta hydrolase family protein [Sphingomonas sp. PB4P5]|uniref:alpha/beta hydrolase family protein n=1 Tax=Parasphingomonas puruogangriensis TaxID=3096155 RepID=UPI002FC64D08